MQVVTGPVDAREIDGAGRVVTVDAMTAEVAVPVESDVVVPGSGMTVGTTGSVVMTVVAVETGVTTAGAWGVGGSSAAGAAIVPRCSAGEPGLWLPSRGGGRNLRSRRA